MSNTFVQFCKVLLICFIVPAFFSSTVIGAPQEKYIQRMVELQKKLENAKSESERSAIIQELAKNAQDMMAAAKEGEESKPGKTGAASSKGPFAKGKDLSDLMDLFALGKEGKIEAIGQLYQEFCKGERVAPDKLSQFYNASLWSALAMHDYRKGLRLVQIGIDQCDAYLKEGTRDTYSAGDEGVFFDRLSLLRAKAQILALSNQVDEAKATVDDLLDQIGKSMLDPTTGKAWKSQTRIGSIVIIQYAAIPVLEGAERVGGTSEAETLLPWIISALDLQEKYLKELGEASNAGDQILENYRRGLAQARGQAFLVSGKGQEAVKVLEGISLKGFDPKTNAWLAYPLMYQARALVLAGKNDEAIQRFKKADEVLENAKKSGNMVAAFSRWWPAFYLGQLHEKDGKLNEAAAEYGKSVNFIRELYSNVSSSQARREYTKESDKVYARLIRVLLEQKKIGEALDKIEESQSKELLDLLGDTLKNQKRFWPQNLQEKENDLRKKLFELERNQDGTGSSTRSLSTPGASEEWRSKRLKLQSEYEQIFVDASQKAREAEEKQAGRSLKKRLENGFSGKGMTNQKLRDSTEFKTLVFQVRGNPCWVLVLGDGKSEAVKLETPFAKIKSSLNKMRRSIISDKPDWRENSKEVYKCLFAPLEDHLKGKEKILIIPDGGLWYIPFSAIVDESGKPFAERFRIGIAPGFGLVKNLLDSSGGETKSQLLILANPDGSLPNAGVEGKQISELANKKGGWKAEVALEEKATKAYFLDAVKKNFGVLHFATHGVLDEANPLYSYLVLKESTSDSGRLEIHEILHQLDLSGKRLAVLSACNTAMGKLAGGNEVVCMQTAFQESGIPCVLASLWEVSDEATSRLMTSFYDSFLSGKSPGESLTLAMRRRISENPSKWAAFQVYGLP